MTYTAISFGLFLLNFTLKCAFSEPASVLRNSCVNHVLFSKRFLQSGPNLKKSDYNNNNNNKFISHHQLGTYLGTGANHTLT